MCSTDVPIAKASPVDDSESSRLYVFSVADPTALVVASVIRIPIDSPQMSQEPLDMGFCNGFSRDIPVAEACQTNNSQMSRLHVLFFNSSESFCD